MKTTSKHFTFFRRAALKVIARLGLQDWNIEFDHAPDAPGDSTYARVEWDANARCACITLTTDWLATTVTPWRLTRVATHEVLHLMLADLCALAKRGSSRDEIDRTEHTVIRRLEKLL